MASDTCKYVVKRTRDVVELDRCDEQPRVDEILQAFAERNVTSLYASNVSRFGRGARPAR